MSQTGRERQAGKEADASRQGVRQGGKGQTGRQVVSGEVRGREGGRAGLAVALLVSASGDYAWPHPSWPQRYQFGSHV